MVVCTIIEPVLLILLLVMMRENGSVNHGGSDHNRPVQCIGIIYVSKFHVLMGVQTNWRKIFIRVLQGLYMLFVE